MLYVLGRASRDRCRRKDEVRAAEMRQALAEEQALPLGFDA